MEGRGGNSTHKTRYDNTLLLNLFNLQIIMQVMALQLRHFPLSSSSSSSSIERNCKAPRFRHLPLPSYAPHQHLHLPSTRNPRIVACVGKEDTQLRQSSSTDQHPDAQDLEYVRQIQRVPLLRSLSLSLSSPFFLFNTLLLAASCRFWSFSRKTETCSSMR